MKTVVAKRTIHKPGPDYKAPKIDPVTGGHLETGIYDVAVTKVGETVDLDDKDADRLIEAGFAEPKKDDQEAKTLVIQSNGDGKGGKGK